MRQAHNWVAQHGAALALIGAAVMLAAPIWWAKTPAMPDYPGHLATFYLIGGGNGGKAYSVHWDFVPNLASEIAVPLLAKLTGLVDATKLFLTAALLLWVLGGGAIHRALYGKTGMAPLFGAFFAYNANFFWGFLNYDFSAGLSLVLFAAWIATQGKKQRIRASGFAVAVTLLYFCHIFAAATLLLMILGFETSQHLRQTERRISDLARRMFWIALIYTPCALAFLFLKPKGANEAGLQFNLSSTMAERFDSLTQYGFDEPAVLLGIVLLAGLTALLFSGKARLHPAMGITLALLLLGALLAPEWAMGGWAVHLRLPAVFAVMLFASTQLCLTRAVTLGLAATALTLIAGDAAAVAQTWTRYDHDLGELYPALAEIPRGSRLMSVMDGDAIGMRADQPYWHLAELAVISRAAFTPLMFATPGQHILRLNPPFDRIAAINAKQGTPPDISDLDALSRGQDNGDPELGDSFGYLMGFQCHFDIAMVVHLDGKPSAVPRMLKLRHAGDVFSLYDIRPGSPCTSP